MLEIDMTEIGRLIRRWEVPEEAAQLVDARRVKVLSGGDVWSNGEQTRKREYLGGQYLAKCRQTVLPIFLLLPLVLDACQ